MNIRLAWAIACLIFLTACTERRDDAQAAQVRALQSELIEARRQLRTVGLERDALNERLNQATLHALQLRNETRYLQASTGQLADAVNRLSSEDWNKVVPDVQLTFSDVENASRDIDARVVRVLNSLAGGSSHQ